jgi:hypothetical protein
MGAVVPHVAADAIKPTRRSKDNERFVFAIDTDAMRTR